MPTPSFFQSTGLYIAVSNPIAISGGSGYLFNIEESISSYSHSIAAFGGFESASIVLNMRQEGIDDWIENGLGRGIKVYDQYQQVVWEGFVNQITTRSGPQSSTRGPLIEICNRVSVMYSKIIDPDADPVVVGSKTETTIAENTDSQSRFGIFEKVLSGGNALTAAVEDARDTFLSENMWPTQSTELSLGGEASELSLTLECRGYFDFLNTYAYNDPASLTEQAHTKIVAVLAADPNGIFSSDVSNIFACAVLVEASEEENRKAMAVIQPILTMGDGFDNRVIFGVYEDRKVFYQQIPTTIDYVYYLLTNGYYIETLPPTSNTVRPWSIRPGKFILYADQLIGFTNNLTPTRKDPRLTFIEKITYTSPYSISTTGSKLGTFAQKLSRLGLGGMSG